MMTDAKREFAVIGLGRMGGNLARQALDKGMRVVGFTRSGAPADLIRAGLVEVRSFADLRAHLSPPRAVFLYIPAGAPVDRVLDDLAAHLEAGDILIDGGNSYWGDSNNRGKSCRRKNI
jgi:6-phosphogluconate dehydrogenase